MSGKSKSCQLPVASCQSAFAGDWHQRTGNSLRIGSRIISGDSPTFVVAEIGVNHDGSVDRALKLVEIARECGADAVKLQIFRADSLMHGSSRFAEYQESRCDEANPVEMLRTYELAEHEIARVVSAIRQSGMMPIATPFSVDDVATIQRMNLPAIKIASPDLVNRVLLERAASCGAAMLVSTGASTIDEVHRAVRWLGDWEAAFALLHCVSSYPTELSDAHLDWIGQLARFGAPVGYSDHTTEEMSGAFATMAGASIIEKHLTYDRSAAGPDHAASADPAAVRAVHSRDSTGRRDARHGWEMHPALRARRAKRQPAESGASTRSVRWRGAGRIEPDRPASRHGHLRRRFCRGGGATGAHASQGRHTSSMGYAHRCRVNGASASSPARARSSG